MQIESIAKRNLDLLKQRQNLEITNAKKKYLRAVENRQNSQLHDCFVSNCILKDLTTNKVEILPAYPKDTYSKPFPRRRIDSVIKKDKVISILHSQTKLILKINFTTKYL